MEYNPDNYFLLFDDLWKMIQARGINIEWETYIDYQLDRLLEWHFMTPEQSVIAYRKNFWESSKLSFWENFETSWSKILYKIINFIWFYYYKLLPNLRQGQQPIFLLAFVGFVSFKSFTRAQSIPPSFVENHTLRMLYFCSVLIQLAQGFESASFMLSKSFPFPLILTTQISNLAVRLR